MHSFMKFTVNFYVHTTTFVLIFTTLCYIKLYLNAYQLYAISSCIFFLFSVDVLKLDPKPYNLESQDLLEGLYRW